MKYKFKIILKTTFFFLILCQSVKILAETNEYKVESHDWLKIYYKSEGINRIHANLVSNIDSVEYRVDNIEGIDSVTKNIYVFPKNSELFSLPVDSIQSMVLGGNIPTLYIETNPYVDEVTSKEVYLDATLKYEPYGDGTEKLEQKVSIKGRGNSSWDHPKKPYRLKFDKKQSLAGLNKAKSFVLLSNFIDNTLMRNAVAMKIAELLDMPYYNKIVPVNLVFNGQQRGNYMLTNKVGINSGSVDIDENEGILWELDTYFDEEFKFHSEHFNLPCMVKDPDFHEITDNSDEAISEIWNYWKNDLENAFELVENGDWRSAFDEEQLIKYFIVQDIVNNRELEHPKSLYLYKTDKNGKYNFGPCWDYDWALGYRFDFNTPIFSKNTPGYRFFINIFQDETFLISFKEMFTKFCEQSLNELMTYINDYAKLIRDSAMADSLIWPQDHNVPDFQSWNTKYFDENVKNLKEWIINRIEFIKSSPTCGLY